MNDKYFYPKNTVGKVNGKVDFDNPPEGIAFTPVQIRREDVVNWGIDPAYVTKHDVGNKKKVLCYMEPTSVAVNKMYLKSDYSDDQRETRSHRCYITSPKTGCKIVCPTTNSCYGCPHAGSLNMETAETASLEKLFEETEYEPGTNDATSNDALDAVDAEELMKELAAIAAKLPNIYRMTENGYAPKEISQFLSININTVYKDLQRIEKAKIEHVKKQINF